MLAAAHGLEGNRHVPLVRRADEDGVNFRIAAQLRVIRLELDRLGQLRREASHPILSQVAECDDCATWLPGDRPPVGPADTHPDDPYPYVIHCGATPSPLPSNTPPPAVGFPIMIQPNAYIALDVM